MKPNTTGEGGFNRPSHSGPTEAWLAQKGWVPTGMQKPVAVRTPKPATVKPARRGRR